MKLSEENTVLVVIDMQEKLLPHIYKNEEVVNNIVKIVHGIQVLEIPILLTEQYPEGLGSTSEKIKTKLTKYEPIEKISFSCVGENDFVDALTKLDRKQVLVCGIEAHVCVYQTCIDLLEKGYEVHLLKDCVSSRLQSNKELACQKLGTNGVAITGVEMALFELLKIAKGKKFKLISRIIR